MFGCISNLVTSFWKRTPRHRPSMTIEIRSSTKESAENWRVAELSFDPTSDNNIISRKLVSTVLEIPIYPMSQCSTDSAQFNKEAINIKEYVDIVWRSDDAPKNVLGPTRFWVSSEYDPPYDAVLGKEDTELQNSMQP
ncbi:hypothetical protein K505DRAFT_320929 [Melanomma pulvis-pyrius CBS 109.77]|uniref:Uncharacterized protein n=1 Tax=Melanomma pulvis-pyrius CBS 109.77 TaxID=1314802 RepID=A0A6A6XT78_9PLEO|nr:hypothetical protein K505DRAFT_320929 [Melanomma pulvis-pyrius CBS 109.77]